MKNLVAGILAHVDAGKTTLSEAMLYQSGTVKRLGRVDHRDAFLDTQALEKARGITIFSKQAVLTLGADVRLNLLDTPGHVDFSAEAERTLQVLDFAVLVISGTDGVQGHTETLWRLLHRYQVPVFLFVNKMDLPGADRAALMAQLQSRLGAGCVDMLAPDWAEQAALCDEALMEDYLAGKKLPLAGLRRSVMRRKLFPCYFGSALKLQGVEPFMQGLAELAPQPDYPAEFGARVFKISRSEQGERLTWLKITGGSLAVRSMLHEQSAEGTLEEKVNALRVYSGAKYTSIEKAEAGMVVAALGPEKTWAGQALGSEPEGQAPALEPVLTCRVLLPEGCDARVMLQNLRKLQEEDPQLHVVWREALGEIHLRLMGEVQLEVLQSLIEERFGVRVEFGPGSILYRETIAAPVEGVGHFEPLRHYAEVHLLLEPAPRGSGLHFETACSEDKLDRNWQRLILTHLEEKEHLGCLAGSPITDMKITLVAGKAHTKHTEGGDFRQATYRAVRQALRKAEPVLLEPVYRFALEVPAEQVGRAMTDLQRMGANFAAPETLGETARISGTGPVRTLQDYGRQVAAYTHGLGRWNANAAGYQECADPAPIVAEIGYDPDRDTLNPADSVFCSHGAGVVVPWNEVESHAHLPMLQLEKPEPEESAPQPVRRRTSAYSGTLEEDKELMAIYEKRFGPIKRRDLLSAAAQRAQEQNHPAPQPELPPVQAAGLSLENAPEYLLVDGYNIIFAWEELQALARQSLDSARQALIDLLCNYQGFCKCCLILVFDAYRVRGNPGSVVREGGIHVVYTREAETADSYIERATYQLGKNRRVRVATSDGAEQMIILGHGSLRVSARTFKQEVEAVNGEIRKIVESHNFKNR